MNNKIFMKIVSLFLVVIIFLPQTNVFAHENDNEKISNSLVNDYALISTENNSSIEINSAATNITGNIFSGGDFVHTGSQLNVNGECNVVGKIIKNSSQAYFKKYTEGFNMLEFENYIVAIRSSMSNECDVYNQDKHLQDNTITIKKDILARDNLKITSSILDGSSYIVANKNIEINTSLIRTSKEEPLFLASEMGNISINSSINNFNGIIYAPNGTVKVNSTNLNFNGKIIAKKIIIISSNVTINDNQEYLKRFFNKIDRPLSWENMIDSDKDGLPDKYELEIGTNPNKADTDGDGLPDGYEVLTSCTDPKNKYTDKNSISDDLLDIDKDGLTNMKEYIIGTDPLEKDTDCDRLSDGDEVNKYFTNPLKFDTDEDGISDGDEVLIGLDPLKKKTNGVDDNMNTVEQKIPTNSEVLSEINSKDNPFKMSISAKVAGNIKDNIIVKETDYANTISNESIVGIAPELIYDDNMKIDKVTYNFQLNDSLISSNNNLSDDSNEFNGIKKYNIFKYFEEENVLVPIKTEVNEQTKTISATTDCFGTYCVVDMEKWSVLMVATPEVQEPDEKSVENQNISTDTNIDSINNINYKEITPEEKEKIALSNVSDSINYKASESVAHNIKGEYVGFNVTNGGYFSIGTTKGNPDIATDNNKRLLFAYDTGSSSHSTISINGNPIMFNGSNIKQNNSSVSTYNNYSGIDTKQNLSIIKNTATGRDDVVQIKYTVTNTTNKAQSVGCRIMMDTMLGDNDHAPFRVLGKPVTTETEYKWNDIPRVWQAFDSLVKPGVVAQGTFYKEGIIKPDKVQFVNWGGVRSTLWDYKINKDRNNGDSAVAITWNETTLKPSEKREYVTYYGLSEFTSDLQPPVALSVAAENKFEYGKNGYSAFSVYSYLENIGNGVANDVTLSIELPEELELSKITPTGYNSTKEKVWNKMNVGTTETCNWLLTVKSNYSNFDDKYVDIKVKLKFKENSKDKNEKEKEITKRILIPGVQFNAITMTGFQKIKLKGVLSDLNRIDTDFDGLSDWKEVNIDLIKKIKQLDNPHVISQADLPTYSELVKKGLPQMFYLIEGLHRYPQLEKVIANTRILPIKSDPTKADSDGDGILDKDEKWDGVDVRYKNINPLRKNTIQTLYPELCNPEGTNKKSYPSYLEIKDNDVTLHLRIMCEGDAKNNALSEFKSKWDEDSELERNECNSIINSLGKDMTFQDVIQDGIKRRWNGTYEASEFDFFKGMKVNFKVNMTEQKTKGWFEKTIKVNVKNGVCGVSNQSGVNWKSKCSRIVTMYTSYCNIDKHENKRGCEDYEKSLKSIAQYEATTAHEFGHVFGLGDMYASAWTNNGYEPKSQNEIRYKKDFHGLPEGMGIMMNNGRAISNDIEILLTAFEENKWQYYVPSKSQKISSAIKEDQVYSKEEEKFRVEYIWDNINLRFIPK